MAFIEVEGNRHRVIETLGYHQAGMPAKFVETSNGERVVVKKNGKWSWWSDHDRIVPLGKVTGMNNAN